MIGINDIDTLYDATAVDRDGDKLGKVGQVYLVDRAVAEREPDPSAVERLGRAEPLGTIDRTRLNVHGGSLGAGHPFGATGGRIVASLAKTLSENPAAVGLISICAAGGLGVTAIMEGIDA